MANTTESWRDNPSAWFITLEKAIRTGNRQRQLQARRELARLGVLVVIDAGSILLPDRQRPEAHEDQK